MRRLQIVPHFLSEAGGVTIDVCNEKDGGVSSDLFLVPQSVKFRPVDWFSVTLSLAPCGEMANHMSK